jgi:hypothetical protein
LSEFKGKNFLTRCVRMFEVRKENRKKEGGEERGEEVSALVEV